jgi:hypothetical protein
MVQPKWRCNFPGAPERPFRIEDLLELAVPGYLTFAQYERNLQTLTANAAAGGTDRKAGPPREGNALLQGKHSRPRRRTGWASMTLRGWPAAW